MYIDNMTALAHLNSDMTTSKSKSIRIAYHRVKEYVKEGNVTFIYIPTDLQMADALTKSVNGPALERCKKAMGVHPIPLVI